jgi:putative toxin-antitoxin system antitoxin component (TIGR02293 family)
MAATVNEVASLLGFSETESRQMSPIHLIQLIEEGLPLSALERLASFVSPEDVNFKYRIVPRATLARRRKPGQAKLLVDEVDRVVRLVRVWVLAEDVWGGEVDARAFFFRNHPLLEGRRPIDVVLASELGAELVSDILGRLQYGTAA